jgi:hypothetical protein
VDEDIGMDIDADVFGLKAHGSGLKAQARPSSMRSKVSPEP